ncbi:MAG: alpha-galactosidase [Acidobacteriota bacterium]|nr:alpha-galactosidase [Acidobacteriota bacterium]
MSGGMVFGRRARRGVLVALAMVAVLSAGTAIVQAEPSAVNDGFRLFDVACPTTTQCTAVDGQGRQVTFNPTAPGNPTPTTVNGSEFASVIACPSATQCTAVATNGDEVTFDPTAPGTPTPVNIGNGLFAIACPSTTQCTAVGANGKQVTFDPTAPGSRTTTTIDGDQLLNGLDCPSTTQCTAVDYAGKQVTFDPTAPGTPATPTTIDGTSPYMNGVACPSISQCTAIDNSGGMMTFDPSAPGDPAYVKVFGGSLTGIACTSTRRCTAVDNSGGQTTFDPLDPAYRPRVTIDGELGLGAVACPAVTQCTAVDDAGQQVTFDPTPPAEPPAGGGGDNPIPRPPVISGLKQSAKIWRVPKDPPLATTSRRRKIPVGTTFIYSLDKDAAVHLSFSRGKTGRKVGATCVPTKRSNRKKPKCTIVDGKFTRFGHEGVNRIMFAGRTSPTNKLKPGKYTLSMRAGVGSGQVSDVKKLKFRIVK